MPDTKSRPTSIHLSLTNHMQRKALSHRHNRGSQLVTNYKIDQVNSSQSITQLITMNKID